MSCEVVDKKFGVTSFNSCTTHVNKNISVNAFFKVMCVSCSGDVQVWDLGPNPRLVVSTSAAHLINQDELILHCSLYHGMPMLAFSNAKAYIYHVDMGMI